VQCSPLDRRPQLVPCLCSPVECGAVLPTSLLCQGGECGTAVSHPPYFGTLECDKVADVQRNHATSRDMGVGRGTVGTRSNEDRIAAAATQVLGYFLLVTWRRNLRLTPGGWGRQFTCRQMAVIAVFAAQRGLEGALIDFWTRRASLLPVRLPSLCARSEIYTPLLKHNMQYRSDKLATTYIAAT
jgi:hypothetical protein